jgi:monovalent cation:H+ antiporter-2, CPA2 family
MLNALLAAVELPMLSDIVVIFGLALLVILLFMKLKIPTIIGFLVTGTLAGPYGFSLVPASTAVEVLSEIGVILLLFVIGMEFSLKNLLAIKKAVIIGGSLQVAITILVSAVISNFMGYDWNVSVFIGFLFALSSTAIVLKLLQEQGKVGTLPGRMTLAILIFQDVIIVPLMLFTPMLAGQSDNIFLSLLFMALKGAMVIFLTIITAKYLVPQLLFRVAKTRSEELFLLSIIVICFAVAYLTSLLGLSLGLGAFLAGLIISESDYSHHATGKILPFREVFLSFFFVSVGMLFDIGFLYENLTVILGLAVLTMVIKFIIATFSVKMLGQDLKSSMMVGLSIFQIGEFSLLLAKEGVKVELLDGETYQFFLAISIFSMAVTPFIVKNRERICKVLNNTIVAKKLDNSTSEESVEKNLNKEELSDHLVIIGFGLNGRNLSRAAKRANIPYCIIEMNPETVKEEVKKGEPIIYGDAANETVIEHVNIHKARVAVIAISDAEATKRIISNIRIRTHSPYILVRTRYVNEIGATLELGADDVIPEEFETSIEIFTRVLNKYLVPKNEIEKFTKEVRSHSYEMFRKVDEQPMVNNEWQLPQINFVSLLVERDSGHFINKPLKEANLRETSGINLVAIKRGEHTITEITGDEKIILGDIIYVVGKPEAIEKFSRMVSTH